ncbi:group III truncated hemoglobin [Rickettsiales endosymbiont of Stachyamoeba lipophora]|uniref:group III truncated hemoglobin n=1 Tax=Rickettsiales endosymbiont of Stachyamoeba lipophora TaxID=2486578 RepID=UPI000F6560B5|nr:group III truncated hemoglobin [Rickettsiales endosymbiont of Stachyamoeba lipophora]AZL15578.1 group III truncated hemoglobin [Rickettsiales endosymbiont of Stachyamoeba lipophora]
MPNKLQINSNFSRNIGGSVGITESMVSSLVHSFYAKIKADPFIGPIFQDKINNNWDEHLATMCDFWSGVALSTGRYKGQPLPKHVVLPGLQEEHFVRWIALFEENAYSICPKEAAEFFIDKAQKIADSLMRGIAFYRGNLNL